MNDRNLHCWLGLLASVAFAGAVYAQGSEKQKLVVGTIYDTAGAYATGSMLQYDGLQLWAKEVNNKGGVLLPKSRKRVPVEVVSYDTQSDPSIAAVRYERLITQDKVDVLVAGFGSTMTAPGLPIAQKNKVVLWNLSSTTPEYFTKGNQYHVNLTMPISTEWPHLLGDYLLSKKADIKRVAVLYDKEEWPQAQASRVRKILQKGGVEVTYYDGYMRDTSNFFPLIQSAVSARPDALLHFGYEVNDREFLRQFSDSGAKVKLLFSMWPGMSYASMAKGLGKTMSYTTTYISPPQVKIANITHGLQLSEFSDRWKTTYPKEPMGLFSVVGYTGGVILQQIIENAQSLSQLDLRRAAVDLSSKITTIRGLYKIDASDGAQLGSDLFIGQIFPAGKNDISIAPIFPPAIATRAAILPIP